jgi:hypothetical protein
MPPGRILVDEAKNVRSDSESNAPYRPPAGADLIRQ